MQLKFLDKNDLRRITIGIKNFCCDCISIVFVDFLDSLPAENDVNRFKLTNGTTERNKSFDLKLR